MKYSVERCRNIFSRTDGQCHICRKKLSLNNFGKFGEKGNWEIEHSNPKSKGGSDNINNLYAACISCNRSKGSSSTKSARNKNGYKHAPYSHGEKINNTWKCGALGSLAALFVPPPYRIIIFFAGIVTGANIGSKLERD